MSECQYGDEIEGIFPPGIFSGDKMPQFELKAEKRRFQLHETQSDQEAINVDLTKYHYFLVDRFGIDLDGADHYKLPNNLIWWPASSFPHDDKLLTLSGETVDADIGTFCGVLLVPRSDLEQTSLAGRRSLEIARNQVKRLKTALDLLYNGNFTVLANGFLIDEPKQKGSNRTILNPSGYHFISNTNQRLVRRARYPAEALAHCVQVAFDQPSKKNLLRYIQRALDSFHLSRTSIDSPLSHLLTWTAIEALISPSDKMELISNMTLCLLGLNQHDNPTIFWESSKKSYNLRSSIVHSWSFPEEEELRVAREFAEEQCVAVLQHAFKRLQEVEKIPRDTMVKELRDNAFIQKES